MFAWQYVRIANRQNIYIDYTYVIPMGKTSIDLTKRDEAILDALVPAVYGTRIEAIRDGLRKIARENGVKAAA